LTETLTEIVIDNFSDARDAYRQKDLRQGLYDAGAVVMDGVLVNLHGDEHRLRRRLENRMFRRETFEHYERDLFPGVMEQTLVPHVAAGRTELVHFGHELMLNLAAVTAGVDRPQGTRAETERLHRYVGYFIEGATLAHSTQDRAERTAVIAGQLRAWREEFLVPSIARRRSLLDAVTAGGAGEESLPRDVLTALLRHGDELSLADDVMTREVAFFLLAGAHTSATAFVRTIDHALSWVAEHPDDLDRLREDRLFAQRCVHETIRLNPSSPVGVRRALADITLRSGVHIAEGSKVVIDLAKVNRDPAIFGDNADAFDPTRTMPDGIAPFGLSFAAGMHVCIGQDLAAGVVTNEDPGEGHLTGLVPVAVQRMFRAGARRDPENPPERDKTTARPYWSSYQVLLGA